MKALVLAGGLPQVALIQKLKNRGIVTVLADYYEKPVAREYADIFYQVSTLDIDAITQVAIKEKVDFLITVCTDQALLTVAKVSEALNLPCYIDYQTALNVTNKEYMKEVFVNNHIATSKHIILRELDLEKISTLRYPLIVKPVDCNSSKGVKRVENTQELKEAFETAVRLSRTDSAVVEEYVEGTELSVDVYVEEGIAHILAVSALDKIPAQDKFVIFRSKCPAKISDAIYKKIQHTAQQIAQAFRLKNTPMLIQMITDGEKIFVLEFSARTGGGEKFISIQKVSGFDVIEAVIDLTLGKKPHVVKENPESKFCVSEFIYCNAGVFDSLYGFDELVQAGVISQYMQFKWKGAEFDTIENSGDRVAGFMIQANDENELITKHNIAVSKMKVLDYQGNDMMRHDILQNLDY